MSGVAIVSGCRTPIGDFNKSLSSISPSELGGTAISGALSRAHVEPTEVSLCVMGQVLYAGEGQCPARQAAVRAGIPHNVPSYNVNMVCGSGMLAIVNAHNHILLNPNDIVVAGGQESMSRAPHLMQIRSPKPMGNTECKDSMVHDALTCPFNQYHMGITAENVAEKYEISRHDQDTFAALSQSRAIEAKNNGIFSDEIVPVKITTRKATTMIEKDEHPRETTLDGLTKLRPCFKTDGTVTPGNCSSINDGGAACVLMSRDLALSRGADTLGYIVSSAMVGCDPAFMGMGPVPAVRAAIEKAGWRLEDVDLFEINEAFAAQSVAVVKELGIPVNKVNINGGAIALGHPVGVSGNRIVITLLYSLARLGLKRGVASLCIGGGMGIALCLEREVN